MTLSCDGVKASSAARTSPARWYRRAGSFSRHREMMEAKPAGTLAGSGRGGSRRSHCTADTNSRHKKVASLWPFRREQPLATEIRGLRSRAGVDLFWRHIRQRSAESWAILRRSRFERLTVKFRWIAAPGQTEIKNFGVTVWSNNDIRGF